ncbi:MAG: hypothetical protein J2O48_10035, partial [Solirubrobacterales bacterium]|nr:hypothetical protein [Solirubrobacterales bacterium]
AALLSRLERLEQGSVTPPEVEPAAKRETPPEPEPEPAPTPLPAGGTQSPPADLAQIKQLWPAVVEIVRGQNGMLAGMLASAQPLGTSGGELVLGLPANAAFFKRKVEQSEHMRTAAEAVRNVTGAQLTLRYELTDAEPAAAADDKLSDEELVRRFVEEFDAKEIEET